MYCTQQSLPYLLQPSAYASVECYAEELEELLRTSWHLVSDRSQLSNPGDFVTFNLLDKEIQVRNFDGTIEALSNVCVHRHALISAMTSGNSPKMQCQYHAWEYGPDGLTRKIPCAKDLAPIDRSKMCLPKYRIETCGQLVFLCLDWSAPDLKSFLGPIYDRVANAFGEDWSKSYESKVQYEANWKVAIENSLEAYHVEAVHPQTFRNAPAEERCRHAFHDRHTSFETDMPFAIHSKIDQFFQNSESWIVKWLGREPKRLYSQHHVFPNLLFSFTDAVSLVHSVQPKHATRSQSTILQYALRPAKIGWFKKQIAKVWSRIEAMILHRIMQEDIAMYPSIQRGLTSSPHQGMLARSEERIHAFHEYWKSQMRRTWIQSASQASPQSTPSIPTSETE